MFTPRNELTRRGMIRENGSEIPSQHRDQPMKIGFHANDLPSIPHMTT